MRAWVLAAIVLAGCGGERVQHEITAPGELLDADGTLREPGWSSKELLHFDPARVHDPKRLRGWDFFTVWDGTAAVNLTIVDLGYMQVCSVGVVDYATDMITETRNLNGLLALSPGLDGSASYRLDAQTPPQMTFDSAAGVTMVAIDIPEVFGPAARGSFVIRRRPEMPFLSVATPFDDDPTNFFFEHKIPGMTAEGTITVAGKTWTFAPGSHAIMDWGRGQWPAELVWRWAGASGTVAGKTLAFNLGEGFGDDSHGTENIVIYGDVVTKLPRVTWTFDREAVLSPWRFRSSDGRLDLTLMPDAPEVGGLDLGDKYSLLKKAYGRFSGTIELGSGETLTIENLSGFAEENEIAW